MVRLLERSHFGDVYAKTPAYRKDDVTLTFGFTWDKNKCLLDEIPFMNSKLHPSWTFSLFILSHLMFFMVFGLICSRQNVVERTGLHKTGLCNLKVTGLVVLQVEMHFVEKCFLCFFMLR